MLSKLCLRGCENMFFALFGLSNRASSLIGPNVVAAIINVTGNNWMGFTFLFGICAAARAPFGLSMSRPGAPTVAASQRLVRLRALREKLV